jgi:SAM-dependent methyltransferase
MSDRAPLNRAMWNAHSDWYQQTHDPDIGAVPKLWGSSCVAEDVVGALGVTTGLDVLELGCGAAQWAVSLAAEGANVIGLDLSEAQLAAARRRSATLPLVHANGEVLPFASGSFDLVFCDHGAMSWGDPYLTVPEAARVVRAGGRLVFNASSPVLIMCYDEDANGVGTTLRRDYFGLWRLDEENGAASYQLPYGEWIRLFRRNGLVVEDLIEIRQPAGGHNSYYASDPEDWFQRWPGESLWVTRRS